MSCIKCTEGISKVRDRCRVCELVDGDVSDKPVWWCSVCKVYLCDRDRKLNLVAIARRILAFGRDLLE